MSTQPLTPEMQRALDVILMGGGMGALGPATQQPQQPPSRGRRIFGGIMDALRVGMDAAASPGDGAAATFGAVTGALDKRDARRQQQQNFELQQMYKQSLANRSSALTRQGDARIGETERHNKASEGTAQQRAETAAGQLGVSKTRNYGQYVRDSVRDGYTPVSREEYESGNIGVPQALGTGQLSAEKQANIARTEQQTKTSASQADVNKARVPYMQAQEANLKARTEGQTIENELDSKYGVAEREADLAYRKAMATRAMRPPNTVSSDKQSYVKVFDRIRTDPGMKAVGTLGQEAEVVLSMLKTGEGITDITAINALQRIVDPNVSVRESDVNLILMSDPALRKALSFDENGRPYWVTKALQGALLTPETRQVMARAVQLLHDKRIARAREDVTQKYKPLADQLGVPWDTVEPMLPTTRFGQGEPGAPPTPGPAPQFSDQQIDEAIRRAGGDPSNPAHRAAALNEMKRRSQ